MASYTTSPFRDITAKPATSVMERTGQLQHRELSTSPTLIEWCVRFLSSHAQELMNIEDICETGPTVYSPHPKRTICR